MYFKLNAEMKLTQPTKENLDAIKENANKQFEKGVKSGQKATKISSFKVDANTITLTIEGSVVPRPHAAFITLKKLILQELGKKHKIGVREAYGKSYEMEFEVEKEAKQKVTVPFAKEVKIKGKTCNVVLEKMDETAFQNNYPDKIIRLVNEKIRDQYYEGREEAKVFLWESKQKKIFYDKDPSVEMENKGWIRRAPGKAQFVYGREITALITTMKELLREEIYDKMGFYEMIFPKFEHWTIPITSGHASYIYPLAYFVSVPKKSDPKSWEDVMDHYKITGEVDLAAVKERSEAIGIMSYAQCPPFWPYLEKRVINEESLPLKVYDWSGPTYRNEAGGTHGIERVEEFNRIETLYVGTKQQVIQTWREITEAFKKFYSEVLDLEIRLFDVSPWWMAHEGKIEQSTKEIGTIDIDIYVPYRGDRTAEWLEVQNASSIGPKYPAAFSVKGRKEEIWSGCCGVSLQRIVLSFLAQKGFDAKNWPEKVRKKFEQKTKGLKELKFT